MLDSLRERRGLVTAKLTTPYILNFSNLHDGPIRTAYPAGQTAGAVLDCWQRPVFDLALTCPDQGNGGSYSIVGPEHDAAKYEQAGVNVFHTETDNVVVGLRRRCCVDDARATTSGLMPRKRSEAQRELIKRNANPIRQRAVVA